MAALIIQKDYLVENYKIMCREAGVTVIPVLKGNAYGLGEKETARLLWDAGARIFAVARLDEALRLRALLPETEILLMTPYGTEAEAEKIIGAHITATVGSYDSGVILNGIAGKHGVKCSVHLKFDTGMGRFGFLPEDADKAAQAAKYLTNLTVKGCFTHLSNCFGKGKKSVKRQLGLFKDCIEVLAKAGVNPGMRHIANSSGALLYPELRLDAVRCGSSLLGRIEVPNKVGLRRVGRLECPICDIRWLPKGHNIGYADTYKTTQPTKIAVVPVGYSDGVFTEKAKDAFRFRDVLRYGFKDFKMLFGQGRLYCTVGGKKARLLGRVGMCSVVADVSDIECHVGDIAEFDANPLYINSDVERIYV